MLVQRICWEKVIIGTLSKVRKEIVYFISIAGSLFWVHWQIAFALTVLQLISLKYLPVKKRREKILFMVYIFTRQKKLNICKENISCFFIEFKVA